MTFCTNCGRPIAPVRESRLNTLPVVDVPAGVPIAAPAAAAAPKKQRPGLWLGGLFGCLGLVGLAGVALIAFGIYAGSRTTGTVANQNADPQNTRSVKDRSGNDAPPEDDRQSAERHLLEIFNDRREAGKFRQVNAKAVPAKDYFPRAAGAAQASYHNGSRYISVSIGKYTDFPPAKEDFDEQFAAIKKKGGKTQILETAADGTIHGVYQHKGNYFAEYCTTSAFCYRLASTDPRALKTFIEDFIKL